MIRKLRKKLIAVSMVSLCIVLFCIFGFVGILNYRKMVSDADHTLSILADSTYEECAEYALLDGYAMYLCGGRQTFEIDVLKAKDEAGVQSLQALLERRMKTLSAGDKAMYDPDFQSMMDNAKLYTDGLFVILLITYDNSAAQSAVDALKQ